MVFAIVILATGCIGRTSANRATTFGTATAAGAPDGFPLDRPVLQIATTGGFRIVTRAVEIIPETTLWGDGRVVFAAGDGFIREGRVPPDAVRRLVRQASVLYNLADRYNDGDATDLITTHFTMETVRGRKSVAIYGFNPERPAPKGEVTAITHGDDGPRLSASDPEPLRQLRELLAAARAALPADAPVMEPEEVVVLTFPADGNPRPTGEWPPALLDQYMHLQGSAAGQGAQQVVGGQGV